MITGSVCHEYRWSAAGGEVLSLRRLGGLDGHPDSISPDRRHSGSLGWHIEGAGMAWAKKLLERRPGLRPDARREWQEVKIMRLSIRTVSKR